MPTSEISNVFSTETATLKLAPLQLQDITPNYRSESEEDNLADLLDTYNTEAEKEEKRDRKEEKKVLALGSEKMVSASKIEVEKTWVHVDNPVISKKIDKPDKVTYGSSNNLIKAPKIFIYTSYNSGIFNIVSKTNRLELILKGNQIKYSLVDLATDDKAKRVWRYGSKGKLLPGVVRDDEVIGDLEYIEELNEYKEIDQILAEI
ncbi:hypothetical protein NADFUDRAFT_83892 [Nadsonia fulvescens var. elongata DSM 6958]|uniref:Glutaredoxin domain-containing protein n=1 Tax=Nadsonia fulvescens var. elongata DSM 6958 TaxID=857566 RepID=A0A1E3PGB4_9ASCO|nr:hypothetical protein NADFUDRAFT_83892 [Nadsonia fulvescens var. elongata DSM 6958]